MTTPYKNLEQLEQDFTNLEVSVQYFRDNLYYSNFTIKEIEEFIEGHALSEEDKKSYNEFYKQIYELERDKNSLVERAKGTNARNISLNKIIAYRPKTELEGSEVHFNMLAEDQKQAQIENRCAEKRYFNDLYNKLKDHNPRADIIKQIDAGRLFPTDLKADTSEIDTKITKLETENKELLLKARKLNVLYTYKELLITKEKKIKNAKANANQLLEDLGEKLTKIEDDIHLQLNSFHNANEYYKKLERLKDIENTLIAFIKNVKQDHVQVLVGEASIYRSYLFQDKIDLSQPITFSLRIDKSIDWVGLIKNDKVLDEVNMKLVAIQEYTSTIVEKYSELHASMQKYIVLNTDYTEYRTVLNHHPSLGNFRISYKQAEEKLGEQTKKLNNVIETINGHVIPNYDSDRCDAISDAKSYKKKALLAFAITAMSALPIPAMLTLGIFTLPLAITASIIAVCSIIVGSYSLYKKFKSDKKINFIEAQNQTHSIYTKLLEEQKTQLENNIHKLNTGLANKPKLIKVMQEIQVLEKGLGISETVIISEDLELLKEHKKQECIDYSKQVNEQSQGRLNQDKRLEFLENHKPLGRTATTDDVVLFSSKFISSEDSKVAKLTRTKSEGSIAERVKEGLLNKDLQRNELKSVSL